MSDSILLRPRLLRRIQAALYTQSVLVTAPGGYGKTTLLRALTREIPHSSYFRLTSADADVAWLQTRLGDLDAQAENILILDDAHVLNDAPETLLWLAQRLDDAPARFVLGARHLALPVTKHALLNLDANDLAFTEQESRALGIADEWQSAARGWALALDLARRTKVAPRAVSDDAAARTQLFELLSRAVFNDLPPALYQFLQRTALPRSFNVELAALVCETDAATARAFLENAQQRALFIQESDKPGWYQYHELVRAFLLAQQTDATLHYERIARWFVAHNDLETALEHALDWHLDALAADWLNEIPPEFIWSANRYRTFRRWVNALSADARAAHPELLMRLGRDLHYLGLTQEGWQYLEQGLALTQAQTARSGNREPLQQAQLIVATAQRRDGEPEAALQTYRAIASDATLAPELRMKTLLGIAGTLDSLARLKEARRACADALVLAEQLRDELQAFQIRINLATVLTSLGEFDAARHELETNALYCAERPGLNITNLAYWCELDYEAGDWDSLREHLMQAGALQRALEDAGHMAIWFEYTRALFHIGNGELDAAQAVLDKAQPYSYEQRLYAAYYRLWLLRRQGSARAVVTRADELLRQELKARRIRALTALEREIAMLDVVEAQPSTEISDALALVPALCLRADMVRLRALLALRCQRAHDARWKHHAQAVLRALDKRAYAQLLIQRDPDLGARFWTLLLQENIALEKTFAALRALGAVNFVAPLLLHQDAAVRTRAANALQDIEREDVLPALHAQLETETDADARRALQAARDTLEALPPPRLEIHLMGEFRVARDGVLISDDAWHRPIVQRLCQFFALHRGERLARDQILDALWSDTEPENAAVTFRTVYSRLRNVLEPHLRAKAPSRYFAVEGDVYRFDPHDRARVDAEQFTKILRAVLNERAQYDIPLLSQEFLHALENFKPLLPQLPLEEWLLEPRERLNALYVEGCLYAAQAQLSYSRFEDALRWAQKTIDAAPWSEEAYQALMRAHARLGNRTLALNAYNDAANALRRELDLEPSPLTNWLAQKLRAGQEI